MQAPEVRFRWGHILFFPCLILACFDQLKIFKSFSNQKYFIIFFINFNSFSVGKILINLILTNPKAKQDFDYSDISKLGVFNGYEIYISDGWQCADYNKICINSPKDDYPIINTGILFS